MTGKATGVVFAALALGCLAVPAAHAGKMSGSGHNAVQNVSTEVKKLPDGRQLMRLRDSQIIMGNNPGNPFHMTTLDCFSTFITAPDGSAGNGTGYCQGMDKDSDLWWITWQGDFNGGTWQFTDGTGKFKGIKGGGTYKPGVALEGGRAVNTWDGTWEMK